MTDQDRLLLTEWRAIRLLSGIIRPMYRWEEKSGYHINSASVSMRGSCQFVKVPGISVPRNGRLSVTVYRIEALVPVGA